MPTRRYKRGLTRGVTAVKEFTLPLIDKCGVSLSLYHDHQVFGRMIEEPCSI